MNSPGFVLSTLTKRFNYSFGRLLVEVGLNMDRYGSSYTNDIAYLLKFPRHKQIMPLQH